MNFMVFTAISVGRGKVADLSRGETGMRTSPCLVTGMSRACCGRHQEVGIMEFGFKGDGLSDYIPPQFSSAVSSDSRYLHAAMPGSSITTEWAKATPPTSLGQTSAKRWPKTSRLV